MSYTREQVLVMTAEELNRAIAEAKGWTHVRLTKLNGWRGRNPKDSYDDGLPNWSGDLAAAWELVEEILSTNREMTLSSETRNDNKRWSIVIFEFRNDGIGTGYTISNFADAPIISLAISRAWLMWKEGRE